MGMGKTEAALAAAVQCGREIASIVPKQKAKGALSLASSPAFGMWKDRKDLDDPVEYVRRQRKGRFGDL